MRKLLTSQDIMQMSYFKSLLDSNGIEALIKNYYLSSGVGELPPNECWPELWILDDTQYVKAKALLETQTPPTTEQPWQCRKCGEQIEAQFAACWKCGSEKPSS